ncbi:Trimethylamine-N-oxide reductase precursor [Mannheimia haemolytica]|uniref:Trimethylamine-N-oxide reductase n=1 Tax=Mannheimia haemolytica TaxID=75985 RepID=A0A378MV64_MANHA|nr:Trimethylamine-N-oxide reductase precursor [Mannheimia haemolytica]
MQQSRRQFLKNMSVMAAAVTMPNFLVPRNVFASEDLSQWKVSGSHWGAMRAKIENGRVAEIKPFEFDKHPTEMLNGIKGLIYSDSRIRYRWCV